MATELPRLVHGINGRSRWQGKSGATFETYEEAAADANTWSLSTDMPPPAPKQSGELTRLQMLGGSIVLIALGMIGPANGYMLATGQYQITKWWVWPILIFGAFIMTGFLVQGTAQFCAAIVYRPEGRKNFDAIWNWWFEKVGIGLLKVVWYLVLAGFGIFVLMKLFEEVGTGMALIILLLAGVLLMLAKIADQLTRRHTGN